MSSISPFSTPIYLSSDTNAEIPAGYLPEEAAGPKAKATEPLTLDNLRNDIDASFTNIGCYRKVDYKGPCKVSSDELNATLALIDKYVGLIPLPYTRKISVPMSVIIRMIKSFVEPEDSKTRRDIPEFVSSALKAKMKSLQEIVAQFGAEI